MGERASEKIRFHHREKLRSLVRVLLGDHEALDLSGYWGMKCLGYPGCALVVFAARARKTGVLVVEIRIVTWVVECLACFRNLYIRC